MFVLPSPYYRYSNGAPLGNGMNQPPGPYGGYVGAPISIQEMNNTISHPEGPEYLFTVGEGQYTLREDIHLATPPPHPSEPPSQNGNALTAAAPPQSPGTKLSLVQIKTRASQLPTSSLVYRTDTLENGNESRTSADTDENCSSNGGGAVSQASKNGDLVYGAGNLNLSGSTGKGAKAGNKKGKGNLSKSNSTFVSRIALCDGLQKKLMERDAEQLMVFANINRAFNWLDMGSATKQDALSRILFTRAHPTCHDINQLTRSNSHLDVVVGFPSGDILWFDAVTNKYARINKNGIINSQAVTDIRWLPNSETMFLASHADGSLIVYDKDKEDEPFTPEPPTTSSPNSRPSTANTSNTTTAPSNPMSFFRINKSVHSPNQKTNPISSYSVAKGPITAFAFNPSGTHLAVTSEDMCLRIINFLQERLTDVYSAYYGGFMCVCWSPDGKYIVTGGQDDLVSIWGFHERRIVARCSGHHSWVTDVSFDPWLCDLASGTYRFGSVGSDARLLLWDFSLAQLFVPKNSTVSNPHRSSISSASPIAVGRSRSGDAASMRVRSDSNLPPNSADDDEVLVHPVEERARCAVLPPVMSKEIDPDPLTQIVFREDCIMTACSQGHIRTWDRPSKGLAGPR